MTLFVCHFVTPCVSHNNGVKSHTPPYNGTGRSSHYELLKCDSGAEKKFNGVPELNGGALTLSG